MNKTVSDYLSENNSQEEKLKNVMALNQGIYSGLIFLLNRIKSYHDLLELETDSNSTASLYIKECETALNKSYETLACLKKIQISETDHFESIEIKVLLNGISKRLEKIGRFKFDLDFTSLDDTETFVFGHLPVLQQLFFELPNILTDSTTKSLDSIRLRCETIRIDEKTFPSRKSSLENGEYIRIKATSAKYVSAGDDMNVVSVFEKQVSMADQKLSDRLVYLYGVILQHKGNLLFFDTKESTEHACVLYFPLLCNQVSMYTDGSMKESDLKGNETILLVDDEDIIWDVVIDMLQNMGYTVILAENGQDCIDIYEANPDQIDLVLLDMVMPKMNGHEAFFALKELDPDVKVLLSSGYVNEEDARDVLNAGAAGFLKKPYRMIELANRIRQIIQNNPEE